MINQVDLDLKFKHILFNEADHTYIDTRTNKNLVSVTTEKKNYLHPFSKDMYKWSAKKQGVDPIWLKNEWERLSIEGKGRGSLLHDYCQFKAYRKTKSLDMNAYPHMHNLVNQIENFFNDHPHWYFTAVECVIADDVNAGQFDAMVWDSITNEDFLIDYKFQKAFRGSYGKQMLEPYSQYPQDTLHEYAWQMSKYEDILNKAGLKVDGRKLIHFSYEDTNYKIYDAPKIDIV